MARVPGSETPRNRSGLQPGDAVRCRRSKACAAAGLADRRGLVIEVRLANACVLFAQPAPQQTAWLPDEQLLAAPDPGHDELQLLARLMAALHAVRLVLDEDELVVFSGEIPGTAFAEVAALLGARLAGLRVEPEGVHEIATRLRLEPPLFA